MREIKSVRISSFGMSTSFLPASMKELAKEIMQSSVDEPNNYEKIVLVFETSEGIKIKITEDEGLFVEMVI